jgi:hypothetical protein
MALRRKNETHSPLQDCGKISLFVIIFLKEQDMQRRIAKVYRKQFHERNIQRLVKGRYA